MKKKKKKDSITQPVSLRCRYCARARHDLCTGRASGCRCMACPGRYRQIMDNATALSKSAFAPDHELRAVLAELVAILAQRRIFADRIASTPPVRAGYCPMCGAEMTGSRYGRPMVTCSPRCRSAKYRAAHRDQIRAADIARRAAQRNQQQVTGSAPSSRPPAPPSAVYSTQPIPAPASPAQPGTGSPADSPTLRLLEQNQWLLDIR